MLGRRSLSFDLKSYDPEIERTLRLLRAHKQEEMAGEPLRPLKEYFTPSNYDSPSSTRLPEIGANQFEIKPSIIQMLPSFYGLSFENPYKHIDEFLEVCFTFKLPNVSEDAIRLRLFPFSLKDKAKHCPKHCATDCPSASSYPEYMEEHVDATQGFKQENPYSNTYNPGWRNHPNFSWRQQNLDRQRQQVNPNGLVNPSTYQSPRYAQPSPQSFQSSGIEHNFQNQVLSALKNLDPMRQLLDSHTQSIAKLETQVGQLANTIARRDEGKLPSFPMENPRGQTYQEETKAVITLRSGKIIDNKDRSNGCFSAKYEG
ncbi:uncharacterized protein G2W53_003779 [Senna tora]|uniref:Uncharacterized protein n=1 Tax=Senna tora TaxID=362788 RepID=A0A835CG23_9FABA|nr:uncharacterized protein G2W53_003779 [Senna tora]